MPDSSAGFFARLFRKRGAAMSGATPAGSSAAETSAAGAAAESLPDGESLPDAGPVTTPPETVDRPEPSEGVEGNQPGPGPAPSVAQRIVTVVALEPQAGLSTLCDALEYRLEGQNLQIRGAGPGLMRAAFDGMLDGTDVLILVAPAEAAATGAFGSKLDWLEANDRAGLVQRTIFVVNYGAGQEGGVLELPAALSRPVVMLPFDEALSLPALPRRAPRRAARHALDQLVAAIKTIPEGTTP